MQAADFLGSTSRLLDYVATDESQEFIVATEEGIIHEMKKLAPNKKLIPALVEDESCNCSECFFMKRNKIGRASCRERVEKKVVEVDIKGRRKEMKRKQ